MQWEGTPRVAFAPAKAHHVDGKLNQNFTRADHAKIVQMHLLTKF